MNVPVFSLSWYSLNFNCVNIRYYISLICLSWFAIKCNSYTYITTYWCIVYTIYYVRYLCLFVHSGVQHILCCVFVLFCFPSSCCQFLWNVHLLIVPSVFSNIYILLYYNFIVNIYKTGMGTSRYNLLVPLHTKYINNINKTNHIIVNV